MTILGAIRWLAAAAAIAAGATAAVSQAIPNLPAQAAPGPTGADRTLSPDASAADIQAGTSLTAAEILTVIENRPEIVIELKQLVAETESSTNPVQPDSISDEMLYHQIASSRELRQNITTFLRARGYVDDRDSGGMSGTLEGSGDRISSLDGGSDRSAGAGALAGPLSDPAARTPESEEAVRNRPGTLNSAPPMQKRSGAESDHGETGKGSNSTDEPRGLHRPAPYNLMSMRDLYTQVPDSAEPLRRFGSEVFTRRDRDVSGAAALDVPIGPDYIVGPGDTLAIDVWGGITQAISRTVATDGHVSALEAGDIQVAGLSLERAQQRIQEALRRQYRDVQVSVSLSRMRTIRVYVVGDVQRPGAYEITSIATPLTALYAAGGPTAVGSLRILRHYRGKSLIGTIDLYDFLLHGVSDNDDRLEAGDSLIVPPAGPQVAVWGAVRRPAIYELSGGSSLEGVLEDAGGLTVAASLEHISIERIDRNRQRETIGFDPSVNSGAGASPEAIRHFEVRDGDRVHVAPIPPYSERVVYLEGHVVRPGRHPFHDGMRLSELLHSYQDLLPEPAARGEIVRLTPPDLHAETVEFSVPDVLIGNGNLPLEPFDTVRILGRYDVDAPRVEIRGEILRPGSYPLSEGMTAAQLVRMAGGFKRGALVETADLISYRVVNGTRVESERSDVHIGEAVDREDASADRTLKAGDVLNIHQITGWNDIGASITIEGEVAHPGNYGFQEGERLSDLLRRAGGFRETAYPAGSVLIREQVRELEEKSRAELIRQIETSSAAARLSPNLGSADPAGQLHQIEQQQEQILSRLKSQPATGRLVIQISENLNQWAGTSRDIEVRRGDVLRIPKRPGFVLVSGQVYNASAITYTPGRSAGWYLEHAGGATEAANRKEIFVIRANGSVVGRRSGEWYDRDVLGTRMQPGDVVVVPQKIIGASLFWRNLLSTAQIASSIAITAAVAGL